MNPEEKSKIDDLNKSLYSRNAPEIRTKRRLRFEEQPVDVKSDWEHTEEGPKEEVELNNRYQDSSMSFFTKLLISSVIFFLIALGIGGYLIFNGANIVSADNVDIMINGPVSVAGGEPVSFEIQISNNNNITLETVDLSVDFPSGTTDAEDSLRELKNIRQLIPDIAPGGVGQKTIQAVLYGEENTKKEIKVAIEYRVKGSNAVSHKEKTFDILISSSPLSLKVDSFKEVTSGQEFELSVTLNSNSKEVIKNLLLKAVYPFGFTYISSNVEAVSDTTVWKIGDIPPGGKKTIKIKGKLDGQDEELRVFRFITGAARLGNDKVIGTEYTTGSQEVAIEKPFMSVRFALDGDSTNDTYIATFNKPVRVEVTYYNNLSTSITDAEVNVKLSGSAFDKGSVSSQDGLYKSATNEIVWNGVTNSELRNIEGGGSGKLAFTLTPRDLSTSAKPLINPNLKFNVSVKAKRNSENNVPENVTSTATREARVSSRLTLSGQTLRSGSAFQNTGPIPPRAEQDTTYTIVWTLDNTLNSASNIEVRSSLPADVKWLGKISPSTEAITYDSVGGEIVWNAGNISTYTAGTTKRKQVSFQVSLNPNVTDVGKIPTLVNQTSFIATDDFTGEGLKGNLGVLTTRFATDPTFKDGDEKVNR